VFPLRLCVCEEYTIFMRPGEPDAHEYFVVMLRGEGATFGLKFGDVRGIIGSIRVQS
jgi:hypothetical protein